MDSQAESFSSSFCSPSFEKALAELSLPQPDEQPIASGSRTIVPSPEPNESYPFPDWPDEDELAALAAFEEGVHEPHLKRKRDETDDLGQSDVFNNESARSQRNIVVADVIYDNNPAYAASKFGGINAFLKHKREKLQIQNADIARTQSVGKPQIFKGIEIYINGYTVPPLTKLRTMIMQHGGTYVPYLDRKGMITHILATNLTPAKFKEFVNYKVATPTWIVDSVAAGKLLDWKKYKLVPSFGEVGGLRDGLSGFLAPKGKGKERVRVEQEEDVEVLEGDPQNEEGAQDIATGHPLVAPDEERTMIDQDVPAKPQNLREIYAPSKGQAPALTTDPTTFQGNARLGYAKNAENQEAKRLMQSEEWREQNTAVSDKFLQGYYKNSRLHHLSTWKSELKLLVAEAQKRAEETALTERMAPRASQRQAYSLAHAVLPKMATRSVKFTGPAVTKAKQDRVIMHVDFDAFFVSCGLSSRPELKGKSVVVCHAQGNQGASSTSEIASCSYEARAFGVKNGMSLGQARGLCPDIRTIPYEFETYREKSLAFYTILMAYADEVQAVSIDEAILDVSQRITQSQRVSPELGGQLEAGNLVKNLAEDIRADIKEATDCEVSIGIGDNMLLARLATRHAKPAGSFHLSPDRVPEFMESLDIGELHNFGYATQKKVESIFQTTKCGDLLKHSKASLQACLGEKNGQTLYNFVRGIDPRPLTPHQERRSVSAEVNYGIRFVTDEEVLKFLTDLSSEVARRLRGIERLGRQATLKVMVRDPEAPQEAPKFMGHGVCTIHNKSAPIQNPVGGPTDDGERIAAAIIRIYRSQTFDAKELRGIGIQIQKLEAKSPMDERAPGQGVLRFAPRPEAVKAAIETVDLTLESSSPTVKETFRPKKMATTKLHVSTLPRLANFVPGKTNPQDIDPDVWSSMSSDEQDEFRNAWRIRRIAVPAAFHMPVLPRASMSPAKSRTRKALNTRSSDDSSVALGNLNDGGPVRRLFFGDSRGLTKSPQKVRALQELTVEAPRRPVIRMGSASASQDLDSILDGISLWMESAGEREPNPREIKALTKYLKRCLDPSCASVGAVQDASMVLGWWRRLCVNRWGVQSKPTPEDEAIGKHWKKAFMQVKREIDVQAAERFGAGLHHP